MTITITTPGFPVHGGIRIIMEWANRLSETNTVHILTTARDKSHPTWFPLSPRIQVHNKPTVLKVTDVLIICSPHSIDLQDHPHCPKKVFIFLQMMEHLFRPSDKAWRELCYKFYLTRHPVILGAHWNASWCREMGREGKIYYVPNGVNFDHFPVERKKQFRKTILLESPDSSNPAKDTDRIALKVAERLSKKGIQVLGYGAHPLGRYPFIDMWYVKPSLERMNDLYRKADVLVKATHYDARALAPMEAMTKGCITARAIDLGDDDLIDGRNCIRTSYDEDNLYTAAMILLEDEHTRDRIKENCFEYASSAGWDPYIEMVRTIITGEPIAKNLEI